MRRGLKTQLDEREVEIQNARREIDRLRGVQAELRETLGLLSTLEPALSRYKKEGAWGRKDWDLDGMRDAMKFRELWNAHDKFSTPVVSETSQKKKKE